MWNTVFVAVHATAALVAFAAGALSLRSGRFLPAYRLGIAVMAVALVPAVAVDWTATDVGARAAFVGLIGLAAAMVVRAELAGRRPLAGGGAPSAAYVDHVGFTLISPAVGFAVVSALRLGAPGWLGGVLAVGVVLGGRAAVARAARCSEPAAAAG